MDKQEILQKSREENRNGDERDMQVLAAAGKLGAQAGMLFCCVTAVLQVLCTGQVNYQSWATYFSILSPLFVYKAVKLRRRHEVVVAAVYTVLFVFFVVLYALALANGRL